MSGALAAAPQLLAAAPAAQAAVTTADATAAPAAPAATAHLDAAILQTDQAVRQAAQAVRQPDQAVRTYTVRSGDTLAAIAQRFYGHASDWTYLYKINKSKISNPNLIYAGEVLAVPADPPASVLNGTYQARHAKAASSSSSSTSASTTADTTSASQSTSQSSSSLTATVQQDIADGNNLLAVAQFLEGNGYSKAAAAGVASCIDGESGGNPESVGDGGGGLIGWTPLSSAQPNPNVVTGNVEQDMMTQLADILFYNSNEIGQSAVSQLNAVSDPVAAADFYSQNFERPAVTDSDVVPSVAEQIFSELGS